jgi:hypothetical protein
MGVLLRNADAPPATPMTIQSPVRPMRRHRAIRALIEASSRPDSSIAYAITNSDASAMMAGLAKAL